MVEGRSTYELTMIDEKVGLWTEREKVVESLLERMASATQGNGRTIRSTGEATGEVEMVTHTMVSFTMIGL